MPVYEVTDKKTGKTYEMEGRRPPTQAEVRSYVDKYEADNAAPPAEENNLAQDVLEGAGLDPIAHPSQIPQALLGMGKQFINPVGAGIDQVKDLYASGKERFGRYYDEVGKSDSGYENALMAGQAAMAPIPFVGNAMENADKAISYDDPHAAGRLAGNVLAAVSPKMTEGAGAEISAATARPRQFMMGAVDRFSPLASTALKSPLARGAAAAGLSYLTNASPSTMLTNGILAASGGEVIGRLGKISRIMNRRNNNPGLFEKVNKERNKGPDIYDSKRSNVIPRPVGEIPPKGTSAVPAVENPVVVTDLESISGDPAFDAKLKDLPEAKSSTRTPIDNTPSTLDKVEEFPTQYKNVKWKKESPPPAKSEIPGSGESPSQTTSLDPVGEIPTSNSTKEAGATGTISKDILRKYVSEGEADQMLQTIEERKWLPETHEEWRKVNAFEEAGMDRMEAMKLVRKLALEKAAAKGAPLNSRENGTSPRQLGVDSRTRGTNPRKLKNLRQEP